MSGPNFSPSNAAFPGLPGMGTITGLPGHGSVPAPTFCPSAQPLVPRWGADLLGQVTASIPSPAAEPVTSVLNGIMGSLSSPTAAELARAVAVAPGKNTKASLEQNQVLAAAKKYMKGNISPCITTLNPVHNGAVDPSSADKIALLAEQYDLMCSDLVNARSSSGGAGASASIVSDIKDANQALQRFSSSYSEVKKPGGNSAEINNMNKAWNDFRELQRRIDESS